MGSGELCGGCSLERNGAGFTEVEVGIRYRENRLLLIGESSGEAEARDGMPFRPYAQSGSLLADAMRETNIGRADVAITNIIRCRPPKDWLEGAPWQGNATQNCVTNYLAAVIRDLQPRAILALGGTAMRVLTETRRGKAFQLEYIRGFARPGAGVAEGVPVVTTFHPSFIRRGAAHLTPLLQRDLRRTFLIATGKMVEGKHFSLDPMRLGLQYQTAPSVREAQAYADALTNDVLAFDIETPMSAREDEENRNSFTERDVKLIQFSQRRGTGIALPWREEYIEIAQSILDKPMDKVGFNCWNFDVPVLENNDTKVRGLIHDAMVMFHVYHPDLPCNLQAVAEYCGFMYPWKHMNENDPEFYGVADADATLCSFDVMKNLLQREEVCG